jgi:hypothetical protein
MSENTIIIIIIIIIIVKGEVVPLHAVVALGVRRVIAPTLS